MDRRVQPLEQEKVNMRILMDLDLSISLKLQEVKLINLDKCLGPQAEFKWLNSFI